MQERLEARVQYTVQSRDTSIQNQGTGQSDPVGDAGVRSTTPGTSLLLLCSHREGTWFGMMEHGVGLLCGALSDEVWHFS